MKLSQVLELAVQLTRDWVSDRPRWGRVEWSRCVVWGGRVPETTAVCRAELAQLRELCVRGQLAADMARTAAVPLVADALATDLVVRLWLCCWARQALDLAGDGPVAGLGAGVGNGHRGWARGALPESVPPILERLVGLREGLLELLVALQVTGGWQAFPCEPDLERLRQGVEQWTDRLTGLLAACWGHREFCLHPARALAWGEERRVWTGAEGPVTAWECDLLGVRAVGPSCGLPAGPGEELRRGVLSLLSARSAEVTEGSGRQKKPRRK